MTQQLLIRDLVLDYGAKPVVNGLDMTLDGGKIAVLLGANGAGKTSTVLGICGLLAPRAGSICIDGLDLQGRSPDDIRRQGIATVLQGHRVLRNMSVLDNLRAAASQLPRQGRAQGVEKVLTLLPELRDKLQAMAGNLSGGQQQMVSIAQSLVATPRFLVIDELSFGLSPLVVSRLVPVLRQVADSGVGILLIEQFTNLALRLADHAYVLSRGALTYDGDPDHLQRNPEVLHAAYFPVAGPTGTAAHAARSDATHALE